jgi:polyhydroxyalkanoate synthesis regulator phasin
MKPDYEITVGEVEQMMQEALEELKGQDVTKNGGISKMIEQVMGENLFLWQHMTFDLCRGKVYCPANDRDIDVVEFKPHYKADKRRYDGVSHRLDHVEIIWTKDIDKSLEFCNVSQQLDYDYSKEQSERLQREIAELEKEIQNRKEALSHHEDIMRTEKYF